MFRDLLMRTGAVNCDEIFHGDLSSNPHRFYSYLLERIEKSPRLVHPESHPRIFADYIERERARAEGKPLAMDVKYFALNLIPAREDVDSRNPFLLRFMRREKAHAVHIVRQNKLRIYVSEEMAKATGKWSASQTGHLVTEKPRLTVDSAQALDFIERQHRQERRVRSMLEKIPGAQELIYEEMFDEEGNFVETTRAAAATCMGVGLEAVDKVPGNLKMNPEPMSALVENYEELAEAVSATEHAWML